MKLNLTKNLDKLRAEAASAIDEHFAGKIAELQRFQAIYDAKLNEARYLRLHGDHGRADYLGEEAKIRGISVTELARKVLENANASTKAMLELEMARQKAKADIRAAAIPAEIEEVKNRHIA